jgi:hypothetical protein
VRSSLALLLSMAFAPNLTTHHEPFFCVLTKQMI